MNGMIHKNRWIIVLTIFIGLLLDILPLPHWALWIKPQWTLLIIMYWAMALSYLVGVGSAFVSGLLLDLLSGTLLGEHALAMVIVVYLVIKFHQRIRVLSFFQQMLCVLVLVLIYQAILFVTQHFVADKPLPLVYWSSSLISAILWPWLFALLRDWRRRFHVT